MNKNRKLTLMQKRAIVGILFISPWLIGFIWFYLRSIFVAFQWSLNDISVGESGGATLNFVGLQNYYYMLFEHGSFNQTLVESIGDICIDVPLIIFFSLLMAIMLNQEFKGRTLVRAIFFLPVILNADAIMDTINSARSMMVNGVSTVAVDASSSAVSINVDYYMMMFEDIGMPVAILDYVVGAVGRISDIITRSGVQIVVFIAALQAIPPSLYEVSKIEGATAYETFWKITFPMVTPLIITNIVYTVVDSFVNSTVVDTAYDMAFTNQQWGYSSAMSLISTLIVCTILGVVCAIISKRTFYYN